MEGDAGLVAIDAIREDAGRQPSTEEMTFILPAGEHALRLLETRRSVGTGFLCEPGPNESELHRILTIGARVPDHGKLQPWRFLILAGDARIEAGRRLSAAYRAEHEFMEEERLDRMSSVMTRVFSHAPLVVLVISSPNLAAKVPLREQEASAAAVCMNLLNAAHAYGFGASWLTGWAAESEGAGKVYGLDQHERVVGIVHIGTPTERPGDRPRPDLSRIVQYWSSVGGTP